MRKVITLCACISEENSVPGWRESRNIIKKLKRLYRRAQQLKRSNAKNPKRSLQREREILKSHQRYIIESTRICIRARMMIADLSGIHTIETTASLLEVENYLQHAERQMDQIKRRVMDKERIPHDEKVFSIFEPHTEWISKGKAGVPQELGVKVCIVEDQYRFILNHTVMLKTSDVDVAVPIMMETKQKYPALTMCSFDKGFYSPENKRRLSGILKSVVLPVKGRGRAAVREEKKQEGFIKARMKHSGVESAIHALGNHGLDRCPDNGLQGFERYTSLAILGRNIQSLGTILWKRDEMLIKRSLARQRKIVA